MQEFIAGKSERAFPNGRQDAILERVHLVRRKVARLLGVTPEEVWFPKSTTDAQFSVANALLKPGDELLVGGLDHPSNYTIWAHLAAKGVRVTVVPHRKGRIPVEELERAVTPATRAIGMCLVNTYNGYREDQPALEKLAADRGLHLILDAIQGLGHLDIDLSGGQVTSLAAGAYKWFCSPEGLGIGYLNRRVFSRVVPERVHFYSADANDPAGWRGLIGGMFEHGFAGGGPFQLSPDIVRLRPDARRLESSPPALSLVGLEQVVDIMTEFGGMAAVEKRVIGLAMNLRVALQEHGHTVLSTSDVAHMSGITSVQVPDSQGFAEFAKARNVHVLPQMATTQDAQAVRVSTHFYNDESDIAALVEAMDDYRKVKR
jgi:selenocysteine lyase/cysteine desulfurase